MMRRIPDYTDYGNLKEVATRVRRKLFRKVKVECLERGVTIQRFIKEALTEKLAREKKKL